MRFCDVGVAAVVSRAFLQETDQATGFPIKELRGYIIQRERDRIVWSQLSADEVFLAQNTDRDTGDMLLPESGVRYCGPTFIMPDELA